MCDHTYINAGAPIATRVFFFFSFFYLEMSLLPTIFCTIAVFSFYGEDVVRFSLPDGVFLPCDHGMDFYNSLCENSFNQPIKVCKSAELTSSALANAITPLTVAPVVQLVTSKPYDVGT